MKIKAKVILEEKYRGSSLQYVHILKVVKDGRYQESCDYPLHVATSQFFLKTTVREFAFIKETSLFAKFHQQIEQACHLSLFCN